MIGFYTNQSATHKAQDGTYTSEGQPNYTSATISVRWQSRRRLVRNQAGQEVVSEAEVWTATQVKANDKLVHSDGREYTVISASPMVGLDGSTEFYKVAL